jgi:hypothetical protein
VLIDRSLRLQERVVRLDDALRGNGTVDIAENGVLRAQNRIADAFSGK